MTPRDRRQIDLMVSDLAASGVALASRDLVFAHLVANEFSERIARDHFKDIVSRAAATRRQRLLELARAH